MTILARISGLPGTHSSNSTRFQSWYASIFATDEAAFMPFPGRFIPSIVGHSRALRREAFLGPHGIQQVWTSWEIGNKALQRFDVIDGRHIPVVAVTRARKHPLLFSAILCAISSSDVAMNEQLTRADIVGTVTDSTSECFSSFEV
jgi:hypothetical protein